MTDGRAGWSEMAATYDRTRAFPGDGDHVVPMAAAKKLAELGARRVLDLGCGTGRFTIPLARTGLAVVGADRSPEMLAMLLAKRTDVPLSVVRCDAEALPFRRSFDAVFFSHFLHLAPPMETLARELRRALRPGAHLVVADTTAGAKPATIRVMKLVKPLVQDSYAPWPTGDDSRDRALLRELVGHLGGDEVEVAPVAVYPQTVSLKETLHHVRERTWWTFRRLDADLCVRAADAAEKQLVAEGADLDARVDEPIHVRLVVARVR